MDKYDACMRLSAPLLTFRHKVRLARRPLSKALYQLRVLRALLALDCSSRRLGWPRKVVSGVWAGVVYDKWASMPIVDHWYGKHRLCRLEASFSIVLLARKRKETSRRGFVAQQACDKQHSLACFAGATKPIPSATYRSFSTPSCWPIWILSWEASLQQVSEPSASLACHGSQSSRISIQGSFLSNISRILM